MKSELTITLTPPISCQLLVISNQLSVIGYQLAVTTHRVTTTNDLAKSITKPPHCNQIFWVAGVFF